MALHSSSTWVCVSSTSPHALQRMSLYLFLKLFFTSSILVLALNIVLALYRGSSLMCRALFPGSQVVRPSSRCFTFDFGLILFVYFGLKEVPSPSFYFTFRCVFFTYQLSRSWSLSCLFFLSTAGLLQLLSFF